MRGSLNERPKGSGTWRLRVYTGERTANDAPVQRSKTIRDVKRRRDAETALAQFVLEVERELHGKHGATLNDLLTRWLSVSRSQRTAYTIKSYEQKLDTRIRPALGKIPLARLNASHLDAAYAKWLDEGLSPTTVSQLHRIIAAALARGVKWGWLDRSPAKDATPPQPRRGRAEGITFDDLARLVRAAEADDEVLGTAVALAAVTGCRRGELCALRWDDVDLQAGVLHVARSLTVVDRQVTEGDTKTHQVRDVALDPIVLGLLQRRKVAQLAKAQRASVPLADNAFILSRVARGDQPCLPTGLTHGFRRVAQKLGMDYHLHQLRHWSATHAIASGADVRTVAARLGHADPSMTLRVYAHAVKARDREVAGVLAAALPSVLAVSPSEVAPGV